MRKLAVVGFGVAAALAMTGGAEAQSAPPVVVPGPEFYVGGGGLYGTGVGRSLSDTLIISNERLGGFAPFAYIGGRVPFRGVFLGIEGEYDFSRRSAEAVLDIPGQPQTVTFNGQTTNFGTVGASTLRHSVRLSDRGAVFGALFVPVGGIELFAKAGVSYSSFDESYSATFNSPANFITSFNCSGPVPTCTVSAVPVTQSNIAVSASQKAFAPVLGGGVQVPFGAFFVRMEGQVEFSGVKTSILPFSNTFQSAASGQTPATSSSFPSNVVASSLANSDAKILLSVGYKW